MSVTGVYRTALRDLITSGGAEVLEEVRNILEVTDRPGAVFYVDSVTGSDSNNGSSPGSPFATLDYAIGQCTANKDDRIYVMAGHAESITAASGITCDVAGISIIGLGHGTVRPTFTWTATASTWVVSAANVKIENIRCTVSIDEVVKLFSASAAGLTLDKVDFFETASAQAIQFLLTTAACDDIVIKNCNHYQVTLAGGSQAWIQLIGCDRAQVIDNRFHLQLADVATSAVISNITTACLGVLIARNQITMTGYTASLVSAILLNSGTTGNVSDNRIGTNTAANTTINVAAGCYSFNNLCTNVADTSGILDPVADI